MVTTHLGADMERLVLYISPQERDGVGSLLEVLGVSQDRVRIVENPLLRPGQVVPIRESEETAQRESQHRYGSRRGLVAS